MKMIKIFPKLFSISTLCASLYFLPVQAVEVTDLYQAKVAVTSQTATAKNKAQRQALKQVLLKLAGSDVTQNNEQLKKALRKPSNYLSQFSYTSEDDVSFLLVDFEQDKINKLLQNAGVDIWGKHRPLATIWLVEEVGDNRSIISDSSTQDSKSLITTIAQSRGIPLHFPLMDLTDNINVGITDVWGRFNENLYSASKRYLAESILIMRISDNSLLPITDCQQDCPNLGFALDWQYVLNDDVIQGSYIGEDKEKLISLAINELADKLHQSYSFSFSLEEQSFIDIEIVNITSIQQFTQVSDILNDLTLVEDVKLVKVHGQKMHFRLDVIADINAIYQALKLEQNLKENIDPLAKISEKPTLSFYWNG